MMFFLEPITPPRIVCAAPCAVEKQTATLICEAGGMPPPRILWFYGQVCDDLVIFLSLFDRENLGNRMFRLGIMKFRSLWFVEIR